MKKFQVEFLLQGSYLIENKRSFLAKKEVEIFLRSRMSFVQKILNTEVRSRSYTTDVLEFDKGNGKIEYTVSFKMPFVYFMQGENDKNAANKVDILINENIEKLEELLATKLQSMYGYVVDVIEVH